MCDKNTARIPLYARDGSIRAYAIVDAAAADWVNQWRWHLDDKGYAKRSIVMDGKQRPLRLHRAIMGMPLVSDGREIDHIDRIPLHCCRSNLRVLLRTGRQNGQNRASHRGSSSQYRGVSWHKGSQSWQARVTVNQRTISLGRFKDEREAAEAARAARAQLLPYATD